MGRCDGNTCITIHCIYAQATLYLLDFGTSQRGKHTKLELLLAMVVPLGPVCCIRDIGGGGVFGPGSGQVRAGQGKPGVQLGDRKSAHHAYTQGAPDLTQQT